MSKTSVILVAVGFAVAIFLTWCSTHEYDKAQLTSIIRHDTTRQVFHDTIKAEPVMLEKPVMIRTKGDPLPFPVYINDTTAMHAAEDALRRLDSCGRLIDGYSSLALYRHFTGIDFSADVFCSPANQSIDLSVQTICNDTTKAAPVPEKTFWQSVLDWFAVLGIAGTATAIILLALKITKII